MLLLAALVALQSTETVIQQRGDGAVQLRRGASRSERKRNCATHEACAACAAYRVAAVTVVVGDRLPAAGAQHEGLALRLHHVASGADNLVVR